MDNPTPKKILVAEDEKPLANALNLKLQHEGFQVVVAQDGEEAISKFQAEPFDLVLLDLIMPKKDGFEVLAALREQNKIVPIFISSNLEQPGDVDRAMKMGANNYYVKVNTSLSDVISLIKQQLKI